MMRRTEELLAQAKILILDDYGKSTKLKASWRAGGVRSAVKAGVSELLIMEIGRWRSSAWRHYLFHSPWDLQGACLQMWNASARVELKEGARVGSVELMSLGEEDVEMAKLLQ